MNYNITDTTIAEPCASSMILSRPLECAFTPNNQHINI